MHPDCLQAPLRLDFDDDALIANWTTLDRLSGAARAGAAIKANGYGTGAAHVAPLLLRAGCRDFFVAHWGELADVLPALEPGMVSVLHGPLFESDVAYARHSGVKPVINSLEQARRWIASGGGRCDLMVDTGMNRLGVAMEQLGNEVLQGLDVDLLISHLVAAEEDTPLNERQRQRWREACQIVAHQRASLANSAGIALGEAYHGQVTRPGIALYGGVPRAEMAPVIRPVVRPQAALLQVRDIAAGETVGYNATFTASTAMRVGTVALGYADGYLRCWSGKGVLRSPGGCALPVLGRVSMDLTIVDLSAAPDLLEGDWLSVDYALEEAARTTGLSQYELLTLLGRRFRR
ncbi:alanine racemase [Novosphingobium profundi]|uniref:alanine racemase n=1 Tax=Novosphingobium profundi TaxID=1774954 RepID=UPI001BD94811|nr:alanine racemase [Novosphingobium profundi]MBT0668972.1 alanine racemase [Novosphingobium profundi]